LFVGIIWFFIMWAITFAAYYYAYQKGLKVGAERQMKRDEYIVQKTANRILFDVEKKFLYVSRLDTIDKFDIKDPKYPHLVDNLKIPMEEAKCLLR
jgi:hypothetical protein